MDYQPGNEPLTVALVHPVAYMTSVSTDGKMRRRDFSLEDDEYGRLQR